MATCGLQRGDSLPVGLAGVGLLGGTAVQRDRRTAGLLGDPARVEEGLMIMVDADPGLDRDRYAVRCGRPTVAIKIIRSRSRLYGSAAPPPLRVTFGTGQPKFRST